MPELLTGRVEIPTIPSGTVYDPDITFPPHLADFLTRLAYCYRVGLVTPNELSLWRYECDEMMQAYRDLTSNQSFSSWRATINADGTETTNNITVWIAQQRVRFNTIVRLLPLARERYD